MKIDTDKLYDIMADRGIFKGDLCRIARIQAHSWQSITRGGEVLLNEAARIATILGVPVADIIADGGNMVADDEL